MNYFIPVRETLYRKRRGILVLRDCIVGHIPRYMWRRIDGRKVGKWKSHALRIERAKLIRSV